MTPLTALRALADHIDRHPCLAEAPVHTSIGLNWFEVQVSGAVQPIVHLLQWRDTLAAPSITAYVPNATVHVHIKGLLGGLPVVVTDVLTGAEADLLRSNFALTDKPVSLPVDRLRELAEQDGAS